MKVGPSTTVHISHDQHPLPLHGLRAPRSLPGSLPQHRTSPEKVPNQLEDFLKREFKAYGFPKAEVKQ